MAVGGGHRGNESRNGVERVACEIGDVPGSELAAVLNGRDRQTCMLTCVHQ